MRRRAIRFIALAVVLFLVEGKLGLALAIAAGVAYEVLGMAVSALWAASVTTLALAPFALMAQGLPARAVVGADFADAHVFARMLVQATIALALYAAAAELTSDRSGDAAAARPVEDAPAPFTGSEPADTPPRSPAAPPPRDD